MIATLTDGTTRRVDAADALGDPDKPVDGVRIRQKFNELLAYAGAGSTVAEPLYSKVQQLAQAPGLAPLLDAFAAAGDVAVNEVGDE
jgi:hypothetical protein